MAAITAEMRRYFEYRKRNPRPKSNYLQRAFQLSEEYKWCTTYGCTTCGAMPFRKFVICSAIEKIDSTINRKYKDELKKSYSLKDYYCIRHLPLPEREQVIKNICETFNLLTSDQVRAMESERGFHDSMIKLLIMEMWHALDKDKSFHLKKIISNKALLKIVNNMESHYEVVMRLERLIRANIFKIEADVIVLPATTVEHTKGISPLRLGDVITGPLHKSAGPKIIQALMRTGPHDPGDAVWTPGFHLKAPHVIHLVVPRYKNGSEKEIDAFRLAYKNLVNLIYLMTPKDIKNEEVKVLVPPVGTDVGGWPRELAAQIAVEELYENFTFLYPYFCVVDDANQAAYQNALRNVKSTEHRLYLRTSID